MLNLSVRLLRHKKSTWKHGRHKPLIVRNCLHGEDGAAGRPDSQESELATLTRMLQIEFLSRLRFNEGAMLTVSNSGRESQKTWFLTTGRGSPQKSCSVRCFWLLAAWKVPLRSRYREEGRSKNRHRPYRGASPGASREIRETSFKSGATGSTLPCRLRAGYVKASCNSCVGVRVRALPAAGSRLHLRLWCRMQWRALHAASSIGNRSISQGGRGVVHTLGHNGEPLAKCSKHRVHRALKSGLWQGEHIGCANRGPRGQH